MLCINHLKTPSASFAKDPSSECRRQSTTAAAKKKQKTKKKTHRKKQTYKSTNSVISSVDGSPRLSIWNSEMEACTREGTVL